MRKTIWWTSINIICHELIVSAILENATIYVDLAILFELIMIMLLPDLEFHQRGGVLLLARCFINIKNSIKND